MPPIALDRKKNKETLYSFCDFLGTKRREAIEFVYSDMWRAYITIVGESFSNALYVLDRFHIAGHLNNAVDNVRRAEVKNSKMLETRRILKNAVGSS